MGCCLEPPPPEVEGPSPAPAPACELLAGPWSCSCFTGVCWLGAPAAGFSLAAAACSFLTHSFHASIAAAAAWHTLLLVCLVSFLRRLPASVRASSSADTCCCASTRSASTARPTWHVMGMFAHGASVVPRIKSRLGFPQGSEHA
eukprot:scaffold185780_cov15-Tisochrysis_lutea.AAC.1